MQVIKVTVKKVKTVTKKVQSTKIKKIAIVWDNTKRIFTKIKCKKWELNEMPDIGTATQGNEGHIQPE